MRRFLSLVKKEVLQFSRDKIIFWFTLYLFTVDIIVAGKGFGISLKNAPFLVWDMVNGPRSVELLSRIREPYFKTVWNYSGWDYLERWIEKSETVGAIVVPPDFERLVASGRTARVLVLLDGSVVSSAMLSYSYLGVIFSRFNGDLLREKMKFQDGEYPYVDARVRVSYNQNLNNEYYSALVELFMNVTMMSMIIAALAFVRERDYGTLEQIKVSPLPFWVFAAAKVAFVCLTILLFVVVGVEVACLGVFRLPFRGSFLLFLFVTFVAILSNCGIGLIIAGFSKRMSQVGLLTVLFLAPILFLSGGWVPPESMPSWLRPITDFSPLKYYLELGLGVVLKGVRAAEIAPQLARYVILSVGLLLLGYGVLVVRVGSE